jgi:hypothetical protein
MASDSSPNHRSLVRLGLETARGRVRIRVQGRLAEHDLGLLEAECRRAWREGSSVTLDLSELRSLDRGAARGIERLRRCGVRTRGSSPFVRALLEAAND